MAAESYIDILSNLNGIKSFFDSLLGKSNWAFTGSVAMAMYADIAGIESRAPHDIDILVGTSDDMMSAYRFLKQTDRLNCDIKGATPPNRLTSIVRGFGCNFSVFLSSDRKNKVKIDIDVMSSGKGFGTLSRDATSITYKKTKYNVIHIKDLIERKMVIIDEFDLDPDDVDNKAINDLTILKKIIDILPTELKTKKIVKKPLKTPPKTIARRKRKFTRAPPSPIYDRPLSMLDFDDEGLDDKIAPLGMLDFDDEGLDDKIAPLGMLDFDDEGLDDKIAPLGMLDFDDEGLDDKIAPLGMLDFEPLSPIVDEPLLNTVFNDFITLSKNLRERDPKADGLSFWKKYKNIFMKYDKYSGGKWKKINKKTIDDVMKHKEYDSKGKMIEKNHFLIQTVRLPDPSTKTTLRKIMQLALNIGQYTGITSKPVKKWMKLRSYLRSNDIKFFSRLIKDNDIERQIKNIK